MDQVNVTEFRQHLSHYLSNAQKGAEILVLSHDQVIARLMPPVNVKNAAQHQLKQLRKDCTIGDVISPIEDHWEAEI